MQCPICGVTGEPGQIEIAYARKIWPDMELENVVWLCTSCMEDVTSYGFGFWNAVKHPGFKATIRKLILRLAFGVKVKYHVID